MLNTKKYFKMFPCIQYFEDLPSYANYLIKYANMHKYAQITFREMLRIRFYNKIT